MASKSLAIRAKNASGEEHGKSDVKYGRELRRKDFLFDENWLNLNHGSFGTYPKSVRTRFHEFQALSEARPDSFLRYEYPNLVDKARADVAKVLNAPIDTIVFVPNATTGINTVLRNLTFTKGDKILYLDCIYGACEKTISYIEETTPAEGVKIEFTLPVEDDWLVQEFRGAIEKVKAQGGRVKVAVFDSIVSMPGVRLPFEKFIEVCREFGVLSCVDAAHGVGHIDLDMEKLDPDFLVSNCHKWLFAPRGCAVFHVPVRNQALLRSTLPTSHGFIPAAKPGVKINNPLPQLGLKSPWVRNFEYVGSIDLSPYLCVPAAIEYRQSLGGESAIQSYCHKLAKSAAVLTAKIFGTEVMDNSTGTLTNCCLSNVRLPLSLPEIEEVAVRTGIDKDSVGPTVAYWLMRKLIDDYAMFMALMFYRGQWWVRLSAQVYLEEADFEVGAERLAELCQKVKKGEFVAGGSKL